VELLIERSAGANIVSGLIDSAVEYDVAGQAKDEVDAVLVAPFHDLRAAIMPVAPDGEPSVWPVPPDAADQAAQMTADLDTSWRLAGAQKHGYRPARRRVVNVDRLEAALVVMGVEQGELLMTVNDRPSRPSGG
jgi:hypothetical protein